MKPYLPFHCNIDNGEVLEGAQAQFLRPITEAENHYLYLF